MTVVEQAPPRETGGPPPERNSHGAWLLGAAVTAGLLAFVLAALGKKTFYVLGALAVMGLVLYSLRDLVGPPLQDALDRARPTRDRAARPQNRRQILTGAALVSVGAAFLAFVGAASTKAILGLVALTVLGVGVRMPSDRLARQLLPWAASGLVIAVVTGIPMFMSAAPLYGNSGPFALKMTLLVSAIVLQTVIHTVRGMYSSPPGRIIACVTLVFWFGIAYAGRAIAFSNLLGMQPY